MGSSVLFVTHDMGVHAHLTDRLGIMYARPPGRGGRHARDLRATAASLHQPPDRQPAAHRRRHADARVWRAPAQSRRSAAGLPLPPALPLAMDVCRREVARHDRDRAGASRRLPCGQRRARRHERPRCSMLSSHAIGARPSRATVCFSRGAFSAVRRCELSARMRGGRRSSPSSASPAAARPRLPG